ncbi:TonB-dependent receptor plug domain-containing protein [Aquimarina sp. 2201CG5-10]|uniref:TonB-dependent receptor plug domain-containing protein n=1 Tax=Aquimarina callyspongiae TaxID=3098150 RepID=UPI002AB57C7C|nr:TonB-dependent receptor [Aquimarina sp. 2201CG5-10]MDY8138893.1 TonB-dependent receptor [Aquimarina sp. 2201CG5-10]
MEKEAYYIFFITVFGVLSGFAQNDSITRLEEVVISDIKIKKFSEGYKVQELTDSVIKRNDVSLTSLLRYNSTIYFRENGIAGISSASFRGTSSSQTAVIWNGININSQLNGQTDFNTVNINNYDNITIRSGGGGVQYGSGAIGGSVHLNNEFNFSDHFTNDLRISYGSFNTTKGNYKIRYGNKKIYSDLGVDFINSDNDYKYLGTDFRNQNGEFKNVNINAGFGVFLSENNVLKVYHNTFLSRRNFSGILSGTSISPSNDSYRDTNSRSLITWKHFNQNYTSKLSVAHLHEMYRFFDNKDSDEYDFGKSNNLITKYDFLYHINKNIQINAIADYSFIQGDGTNFGGAQDRNIFSGVLLYKHTINKKFNYGVNIRQEITSDYDSPLLFALDAKFTPYQNYTIKFNGSRNYRIPTYNDLYWVGPGGLGNPDLQPETSLQAEIGQELKYKNISISATGYYINAKDLIRWIPVSGTVWSPVNIDEVESYGVEVGLGYQKDWKDHKLLLQNNYAYTVSEDKEREKQLIYVPFHKVTSSISYSYKRLSAYYQFLYNGPVFITTDNTREIEGYDVSNLGVAYTYYKTRNKEFTIDIRTNNLYNRNYQNVGFRPMPNRNYQIQLIFKF